MSIISNFPSGIPAVQKGAANGVASLGSDGKIPSSQLPAMDYVPTTRKINGESLDHDLTISGLPEASASDEGKVLQVGSTGEWEKSEVEEATLVGIDTSPVNGSTNLITSGGVYTAVSGKLDASQKGAASGVASLGSDGKIPFSQLPTYDGTVV